MSAFDFPSNTKFLNGDGSTAAEWIYWFNRVNSIAQSLQQAGPTADRPTTQVWVGRQFYDTTLNKPVWVSSVRPIVWRDAAGVIS